MANFEKGRGTPVPTEYGSTVKNLTLTFWPKFFSWLPYMCRNSQKKLGQKPNVKFFRVYTYLWGTFNLGFAKMTKFDTFGRISPCRWGRRGKKLSTKKNWSICRPVCREINFFTQNIGMFDWFGHLNISVYTHHRVTWYSSSSEYRTKRCGHHHDPCDFSITLWSFGRIARKIVKGIILAASDCRIYF